jgi:acyl-coenzyme A synthetase/AMP-(fatty) acid ligase
VGRESQALKILGELVYLGPLQARLDALVMSTAQSVIVPMPDERKGTTLVLATTADDGDALMKQFNSLVAPYERIDRAARVLSIPTTDLGKVKMPELVRMLA